MSNPNASTPAQLMAALFVDLSTWAKGQRGSIHLAKDLEHAVLLLSDAPGAWSGVLLWEGDEPAGSGTRRGGVVENNIRLFLRCQMGLDATPGISLIRPTAARQIPILELLEMVRTQMLRYSFTGVNPPGNRFTYKGTSDQTQIGDKALAVYSMSFGVWTVIRMPDEEEINLAPTDTTAAPIGGGSGGA